MADVEFKITGVMAPTGLTLRGRLYAPDGSTVGDNPLSESPASSGQYGGTVILSGLSDSGNSPHEYEVREVSTQTSGDFDSSIIIWRSRGPYKYLLSGIWYENLTPPVEAGNPNTGTGDVVVDRSSGHNLGTNGFRYLYENGDPADNVEVSAYLKSDYDSQIMTLRGVTYTDIDGYPAAPLMLDPGTYYFVARDQDKTRPVVITEVEVA